MHLKKMLVFCEKSTTLYERPNRSSFVLYIEKRKKLKCEWYSVSYIEDYVKYIIKMYKKLTMTYWYRSA